jgi:hypothetical protein
VVFNCASNITTLSVNGLRDIEKRYKDIENAVPGFDRKNPIKSDNKIIPAFTLPAKCGSGIRIDCKTKKHTEI